MRRLTAEVGIGVVAGAVVLLLTTLVESIAPWLRILAIIATAAVAFAIVHWATRGGQEPPPSTTQSVRIGNDIDTDGGVDISDIEVTGQSKGTSVGERLRAKENVNIEHIRVDGSDT